MLVRYSHRLLKYCNVTNEHEFFFFLLSPALQCLKVFFFPSAVGTNLTPYRIHIREEQEEEGEGGHYHSNSLFF